MTEMSTQRLEVPTRLQSRFFSPGDPILKTVESKFPNLTFESRGGTIGITGPVTEVAAAAKLVEELLLLADSGVSLDERLVSHSNEILADTEAQPPSLQLGAAVINTPAKQVRAKTSGQRAYLDAIDRNTVTFGIGPAGTGKTYLAVAKAVEALFRKEVSRIILTRPAVEAGERLGFLPGTLSEKIDPYLRPLFDSLQEMLEPEATSRMMQAGVIEVAPLAYMRGRTLNDAFVILDEAQNTTPEQMKMFLTRLGFNSKMVVTGDTSQVDLPGGRSGLNTATKVLEGIADLHVSRLSSADVVRHQLVTKIVEAYERLELANTGDVK